MYVHTLNSVHSLSYKLSGFYILSQIKLKKAWNYKTLKFESNQIKISQIESTLKSPKSFWDVCSIDMQIGRINRCHIMMVKVFLLMNSDAHHR